MSDCGFADISFNATNILVLSMRSSILERISWPKMNSYDKSGSPCLRPLLGLKLFDLPLLTRTSKETEEMQE